jgi:hypothetical protein
VKEVGENRIRKVINPKEEEQESQGRKYRGRKKG